MIDRLLFMSVGVLTTSPPLHCSGQLGIRIPHILLMLAEIGILLTTRVHLLVVEGMEELIALDSGRNICGEAIGSINITCGLGTN